MLTSSDNTVTLPAGYYDAVTVTTSITNLTGTITYSHHIHSLDSNSETEENTQLAVTSVTSGYADTHVSSDKGGCFTEPYYSYTYNSSTPCTAGTSSITPVAAGQRDDEWGNTVYFAYVKCNYCGGRSPSYSCYGSSEEACRNARAHCISGTLTISHGSVNKSGSGEGTAAQMATVMNITSKTVVGYSCSCGYTNGQVLSATITY